VRDTPTGLRPIRIDRWVASSTVRRDSYRGNSLAPSQPGVEPDAPAAGCPSRARDLPRIAIAALRGGV